MVVRYMKFAAATYAGTAIYQQRHCSRTVQTNVQQEVGGNCIQPSFLGPYQL